MKKIIVNQNKCIGCGMCTITAPKTFRLGKNGKSEVTSQTAGTEEEVNEAIKNCPVNAISREIS